MAFSAYPSLSGAIEAHKVTLLATNGATRSPQAPDAPPIADWIPGFNFAPIIGLVAREGDRAVLTVRGRLLANEVATRLGARLGTSILHR